MAFQVGSTLLDSMVLAIVSEGDTYGYRITQDIHKAISVSESTLYPVLRRLQKDALLETYDKEYMGRNRRYYKITSEGVAKLAAYKQEWEDYKKNIEKVLLGGNCND